MIATTITKAVVAPPGANSGIVLRYSPSRSASVAPDTAAASVPTSVMPI